LALGNIYSDPNYHNLNHWGVIQALNKKGVTVNDQSVTETVLIQTTPLKLVSINFYHILSYSVIIYS